MGELFALNYLVVGISLSTIYFLFKRQGGRHPVFSPFVAKELHRFLVKALPFWVTSAICAIAWLTLR